ncbi:hypothetical protein AB0K47_27185 [Streptomyces tirandamycinicus]|uniref:hypothetical protein n=1 Tax=Streptomyces TaxID=1883 RepID=UPI00106D3264|nr:hypothetical protein [Streptomyces sp. ICN441]TFE47378.1 hypothetical protein E3E14_21535 [Streptomyces sp. ICN441]
MNGWLLTAGAAAAGTTLIHALAGGRDVVRPLLGSRMAAPPLRTLHAVWHFATADLLFSAVALVVMGLRAEPDIPLTLFIAAHYFAYTAVFLVVALAADWPRPLLRLPQWMLLLPVGILAVIGVL